MVYASYAIPEKQDVRLENVNRSQDEGFKNPENDDRIQENRIRNNRNSKSRMPDSFLFAIQPEIFYAQFLFHLKKLRVSIYLLFL